MPREQHRRRDKASRRRGDLLCVAYLIGDREVFEVVVRPDGVHVRLTCDPAKVLGADRERAADWLKAHFPRLTHDQRYDLLFKPQS